MGILRVLLTTCPNNAKSAGGIDLHSEWSSCLNLLLLHKEFFSVNGFKSKVFEKSTELIIPKSKDSLPTEDISKKQNKNPEDSDMVDSSSTESPATVH